MVRFLIFITLFFGSCAYALIRGNRDLRIAGTALLIAGISSAFSGPAPGSDGTGIDWPLFTIDGILLGVLLWIALHSRRYWPIWLTGLHMIQVAGHILPLIDHSVTGWLYWFATAVWAYPIHCVLIIATYRQRMRQGLRRWEPSLDPSKTQAF